MKVAKLFNFNKEKAKEKTIAVSAGACAVSGATYLLGKYIARPYISHVINHNDNFSDAEKFVCRKQISQALDVSGLKAKDVIVTDISFKNMDKAVNELALRSKITTDKSVLDKLFETIRRFKRPKNPKKILQQRYKAMEIYAKGENAVFLPSANSIVINTKKIPQISFHEMGHALNANTNKFGKTLFATRYFTPLLIPIIGITAFLTNKKSKGEKPKNNLDKTTTFIKENAGKLTFACFIPTLLEEGLASIKGGGIANKVLPKDIVKKINKANLKAWGTYALGAAIASCAMSFGVYVKDNMFKNKDAK